MYINNTIEMEVMFQMAGVNKMTGVPWHVETLHMNESDERRHQSRCIYFDHQTKLCKTVKSPYYGFHCGGSTTCNCYFEHLSTFEDTNINSSIGNKVKNDEKAHSKSLNESAYKIFNESDKIYHEKFGAGIIREIIDDTIIAVFDNKMIIKLSVSVCVDKNILKKI